MSLLSLYYREAVVHESYVLGLALQVRCEGRLRKFSKSYWVAIHLADWSYKRIPVKMKLLKGLQAFLEKNKRLSDKWKSKLCQEYLKYARYFKALFTNYAQQTAESTELFSRHSVFLSLSEKSVKKK